MGTLISSTVGTHPLTLPGRRFYLAFLDVHKPCIPNVQLRSKGFHSTSAGCGEEWAQGRQSVGRLVAAGSHPQSQMPASPAAISLPAAAAATAAKAARQLTQGGSPHCAPDPLAYACSSGMRPRRGPTPQLLRWKISEWRSCQPTMSLLRWSSSCHRFEEGPADRVGGWVGEQAASALISARVPPPMQPTQACLLPACTDSRHSSAVAGMLVLIPPGWQASCCCGNGPLGSTQR